MLSGNRLRPKSIKLSTMSTCLASVLPKIKKVEIKVFKKYYKVDFKELCLPFPNSAFVSGLPGCISRTKMSPMMADRSEVTKK